MCGKMGKNKFINMAALKTGFTKCSTENQGKNVTVKYKIQNKEQ